MYYLLDEVMKKQETAGQSLMEQLLEKLEIGFEGQIFSNEKIIRAFGCFISNTIDKRDHNVGFILHTGSICFDALIIAYTSILSIISNDTDPEEFMSSLEEGMLVLFGDGKKERYEFVGIVEDGIELGKAYEGKRLAVLRQGGGIKYVLEKRWRLISPYNGESTKLDGRGIKSKKTNRESFFLDIMGLDETDIPNIIDASNVIVCERSKADRLLKGIYFRFNGKILPLLDLFTASYYNYTGEEVYRYAGNTAKTEPIIKVTSKVSAARKLVLSKNGNKHVGITVLGGDIIKRCETEMPGIIGRRSLQYVYLSYQIDNEYGLDVIKEDEDVEVFACTQDFLYENSEITAQDNNRLTEMLSEQIKAIVNRDIKEQIIEGSPIDTDTYAEFRKCILAIKRSEYTAEKKEEFVILAYSFMNLILTMPFSMKELIRACESGAVDIDRPDKRIDSLTEIALRFPEVIREKAKTVIEILREAYEITQDNSQKARWLNEYIMQNQGKRIAVVFPKAYYANVVKDNWFLTGNNNGNVLFYTTGRFDTESLFDTIIAVGNIEGKRFSPFRCNEAPEIITLLYEAERKHFQHKRKINEKRIRFYEYRTGKTAGKYQDSGTPNDFYDEDEPEKESIEIGEEIEEYIKISEDRMLTYGYGMQSFGGARNIMANVVAIAKFTDDTKAFFSKNYEGYVLNIETGDVKELAATEFCEGDSIVFTRSNGETKDVVDSILMWMIDEKRLKEEIINLYNRSKLWKRKLIEYATENGISAREVAGRMMANGSSVQEATILGWMDADSHTVGPRKMVSIEQIGRLVEDDYLINHANECFEACREIRRIRRRILEQIGNAIIDRLSGRPMLRGPEYDAIYKNIGSLAEIKQIEKIVFTERSLPMAVTNRPIST